MKRIQRTRHHRNGRSPRPRLQFEALESRRVLDATPVEIIPLAVETEVIEITANEIKANDITANDGSVGGDDADLVTSADASSASNSSSASDASNTSIRIHQVGSSEELHQLLLKRAIEQYGGMFGMATYPYWPVWPANGDLDLARVAMTNAGMEVAGHSTNVQVAGVDEADIVKTDGEYLYLGGQDNRLTIVDIRDPANLQLVSRLQLPQHPTELYVTGDRLIVISRDFATIPFDGQVGILRPAIWAPLDPQVAVTVFDITERAQPELVSTTRIDGNLVQSRLVGEDVYLVTTSGLQLPSPKIICEDLKLIEDNDPTNSTSGQGSDVNATSLRREALWLTAPGGLLDPLQRPTPSACRYETEAEYTGRVSEGLVAAAIPDVTYELGDGTKSETELLVPENIYFDGTQGWQMVSVSVLDTSDTPAITASAGLVTTMAHQIYATADHVYLAGQDWNQGITTTGIYQFTVDVAAPSVELTAAGSVPGHLLNQFSLDEYEGRLRVATTQGWGTDATNGVYVLEADGESLVTVGAVTGIAPGETIFAARFVGDQAYLVTFLRIDPVVVIDLSDPTDPTVTGELKIPGFSNYLHPLDGGFLIGIGRDADPNTGWGTDPQVSLFDVNGAPTLVGRFTIDLPEWSWSPVFETHHAFNYYADLGLLAVPFTAPQMFEPIRPGELIPAIADQLFVVDADLPQRPVSQPVLDDLAREIEDLPAEARERLRREAANLPESLRSLAAALLAEGESGSEEARQPASGLWLFRIAPDGERPVEWVDTISHAGPVLRSIRVGEVLFTISADTVTSHELSGERRQLDDLYVGQYARDDYSRVVVEEGRTRLAVLENDMADESARVVAVSGTTAGGQVQISDDGRSVIYVPPAITDAAGSQLDTQADLRRVAYLPPTVAGDSFQYTLDNGHGVTETATVYLTLVHAQPPHDNEGVFPDVFRVRQDSQDNKLNVLANDFPNVRFIRPPQVTAVSETSAGGKVTIGDGGLILVYTPPAGYAGRDTFTYTVDQGPSGRVTVEVVPTGEVPPTDPCDGNERMDPSGRTRDPVVCDPVEGTGATGGGTEDPPATGDWIRVSLSATDADGNPVTRVELGDTFYVTVSVEDLRSRAEGVFSAYLDLNFNSQLAQVAGAFEFEGPYTNGRSGEVLQGVIDELGAFSSLEPVGGEQQVVVRVPFEATALGILELSADPADDQPSHDFGMYGLNSAVRARLIDFQGVRVEVVNGWHNVDEPTDVNADRTTTAQDALVIINRLNLDGIGDIREKIVRQREAQQRVSQGTVEGARELAAELAGQSTSRVASRMFYDVNRDGFLTALDPLVVINRLNALAARRAAVEAGDAEPLETEVASRESALLAADLTRPAESATRPVSSSDSPDAVCDMDPTEAIRPRDQRAGLATIGASDSRHASPSAARTASTASVAEPCLDDILDDLAHPDSQLDAVDEALAGW